MMNNEGRSEDRDDNSTEDEHSALINKGQQPVQARKDWDVFTNNPPVIMSGSMADQTCIEVSLQIVKVLAYICTFLFVLGGAVLSKGTLLFMTSHISSNTRIDYCNETLNETQKVQITLNEQERVGWIWCLFFAFAVPEVLSFLRSTRICFFKIVTKPTVLQFLVVFITESLKTIGTGLLVFMILPTLDVVKGAMITNGLCFVPGLLAVISLHEETKGRLDTAYYVRQGINCLAVAFQLIGFVSWGAAHPNVLHGLVLPIALILISCGWWENFFTATNKPAITRFFQDLKASRHYTFLYVSVWKIVCFFLTMLMVVPHIQEDSADPVGNLFNMFGQSFSQPEITVTEVGPDGVLHTVERISSSALLVLLIHALGSYICYITGKFACRILIQEIGFALPVTITVPVVIPLLLIFWGLKNANSCHFNGIIPDYLFFNPPSSNDVGEFLATEHAWAWLLCLLSQAWISRHIWMPNVEHLMSTEVLFCMPMYDSLFVDQSLAFNRRHDKKKETSAEEPDVGNEENFVPQYQYDVEMEPGSERVKESDHIRRVYACVTMWHETPNEMKTMLKSILRMDWDQAARRLAQKYLKVVDPDYYEFEAHVFFDDAFELSEDNEDEFVVNKFVTNLMNMVDVAAKEVHGTDCHIRPPVKYPTPYGGRLVWTLPGKTKMYVHLKNKDKIRHKKRWSQVMYMYYILGHRLMELPIHVERKEIIAKNTFILALDGDIDFKPEAVLLLLDRMKKDENLGAACGRIHPTGSGPMVWYQKFEYAIAHWLQKATEHVIGCVLCSPGCFSLFRGEALMDDAVMNKLTKVSKEATHFLRYDQGEDRWLCTLLIQRGYRVEYSAVSDSYTQCPEGFDEFYNQRRRWYPSHMASTLDFIMDAKQTVKINNNISYLYIVYQAALFGGSILGAGTIFLMLVGALVVALKIDIWTSFWLNIVPILIYLFVCLYCKEKIQLTTAKIISAIYVFVMMAVLVSVMLQIHENGPLTPASLAFFMVAGGFFITAVLHPQDFGLLILGLVYYVAVPCMNLLLMVYAIFNLNVVSWGTREVATKKSKMELEQEKKAADKAKKEAKKKSFWGFLSRDQKKKDEEDGSFECSMAGLSNCLMCTHPKGSEEKLQLLRIADSLEKINRRMDNMERAVDPAPQSQQRRRTSIGLGKRDLDPLTENEENDLDEDTDSFTDDEDTESKEVRDEQVTPYWIDHHPEMKKGIVEFLSPKEMQFWNDFIDKYLYVLKKDVTEEKEYEKKLKELRDLAVFGFIMLNGILVLVTFLLQLHSDVVHIKWTLGVTDETREYQEIDAIAMAFVVVFGVNLIIQFIAMLFHRFGTLEHMLARTHISGFKGDAQSDDKHVDPKTAVQFAKHLQDLRGADGDVVKERELMEENVGRRKTVRYIHNSHYIHQKEQAPVSLETAFKRRLSRLREDDVPGIYRKLSHRHRETVNHMVVTGRKSIMELKERRKSQLKPESSMGPMNNLQPGDTPTETQI